MENFIDKPIELYDKKFKDEFAENSKKFFDDLVQKSGVNSEANKETCEKYYQACEDAGSTQKKINKLKALRTFLIICSILSVIVSIATTYETDLRTVGYIIAGVLFVVFVLVICIWVNPPIKNGKYLKDEYDKIAKGFLDEACEQLKPLYELFDYSIPTKIINKTVPLIQMDDNFNIIRHKQLIDNYGFIENLEENNSVKCVSSGKILGNPFVLFTYRKQVVGQRTYYGSLNISWQTVERDFNGNTKVVTHTETLQASTIHPCPEYYSQVSLAYGNDAAPDLNFTRFPSGVNGMNDKQIEKQVNKIGKQIEKKARKEIDSGFTAMTNTEFDALFGATDRDNETQFRLLFTPLAQQNEVETIKDRTYFGDDFEFYKMGKLNLISSNHSNGFDFSANPSIYTSFDLEVINSNFNTYMCKFFKYLYFDLVPLLNIPLYQQTKSRDYIYKRTSETERNYSAFEAEVLANAFNSDVFIPNGACTETILKTALQKSSENDDILQVTGYSFNAVNRLEYVSVKGGDGYYHDVPVEWVEYIPIYKQSIMELKNVEQNDNDQWNVNQRGLKARAF